MVTGKGAGTLPATHFDARWIGGRRHHVKKNQGKSSFFFMWYYDTAKLL
jgi:hypothetical protein